MESEYLLDPFFKLSPHLQCITTSEGILVRVNPAFASITGRSAKEVDGISVFDLASESSRAEMEGHWREAGRTGEAVQFLNWIRKPDGSRGRLDWHVAANGELIYAAARDLTRRQMAEDRFRLVVDHAPNGIVMVNGSGKIILANPQVESLFGYEGGEMVGKGIEDLVPERLRGRHAGSREGFHASPSARAMGAGRDLRARRKDGTEFPVEIGLTPIDSEEGPLVLAVVVDITERRRLETEVLEISEQEQRRIGRDIHDDICQQLAGIGCLVSLVIEGNVKQPGGQGEMLKEIARLVTEANTRARDISRGLVSGEIESEGLNRALESLASATERLFNIRCRVDFGRDTDLANEKAKVQLYRIAQEAISNAVRHGKAGSIVIALTRNGDRLEMKVSDDGRGYEKPAESHEGIGLLGMSRRAKMMNGQLGIEGSSEEGTTVTCSIPWMN